MKKVFLLCYINLNLGDDLFLKIIIERYPNSLFYIYGNPSFLDYYRKYNNVKIMNKVTYLFFMFIRKYLFWLYKVIFNKKSKKFHAVVRIGGSIFQEGVNKLDLSVKNQNYYIIGANYGPEKTIEYRNRVFNELLNVSDCCFRDKYSYNIFRELSNVRYAPDIILSHKFNKLPMIYKTIGISVIDPSIHAGMKICKDRYIDLISNFCTYAISKGFSISLFNFCNRENDSLISRKIIEKNNSSKISICDYIGDIDDFIAKFSCMEYIIASRFHAMILGWYFKIKVLPFVYSDKHINVINDFNYLDSFLDFRLDTEYSPEFIFDKLISNNVVEDIEKLKEKASGHFVLLDNLLD